MKKYVELYKKFGATHNVDEICPGLDLSNTFYADAETKGRAGVGKVSDLRKCIKPDNDSPKALRDAFAATQQGAEKNYRLKMGDEFHRQIEKRVMGAMMLSECCDNSTCQAKALTNMDIDLKGAKSDTVK
jgi:hypothetical protein